MGIDPVELRRRNLLRRDDLPYANPNGMTYDSISPLETFEQALDDPRLRRVPRRTGRGPHARAATSVSASRATSSRRRRATAATRTEAATIRIEPSGTVNVYIAGGSSGNSLETTVVQLAADALGVDIDDVHTIQGDTAVTGFGAGTAGSRSASMTAGAVRETAAILRERIRAIAAAPPRGGGRRHRAWRAVAAFVRGTPSIGISLAEIAALAYFEPQSLPPGVPAGLEATQSVHRDERVDLGERHARVHVRGRRRDRPRELLRYIVSEDCGPMINPDVVEGQIAGGVVQGIGGALFEHLAYDDDGNPLATTFLDYLVPSAAEVPSIEYGHIETPSPGPGGFKGVGEGGAIGAPPAVVNAVADALAPFGVDHHAPAAVARAHRRAAERNIDDD